MLLKQRTLLDRAPGRVTGLVVASTPRGRRLRWLRILSLLAFAGALCVVLFAGVVNLGWLWKNRVVPEANNFGRWLTSTTVTPRHLELDIKFKDFQWLAFKRQEALGVGNLIHGDEDFVSARIRLPDRSIKAKIRLKGDVVDHLDGDKWSYRIKVTEDDAVFGMTFFSIQDPVRSAFAYEWVFHQIMRHAGLIAPRYDFIDVTINGKKMGIYALEESFSKELVEAHGRREAPIVRLDEKGLFFDDAPFYQREIFFASHVDAFQSAKTNTDPVLRKQFAIARALLEGFRDQRLSVEEVFDVDKTATFFALIDLCSASHAVRWKNIRFYYDPVTSLLEPIPYNAYTARSAAGSRMGPVSWIAGQYVYSRFHVTEWMDAFFRDPVFYRAYVQALAKVSDPAFIEGFFASIDEQLEEKLKIIHKDAPAFQFSKEYILGNARTIRNAVKPKLAISAHVDFDKNRSGIETLSVANTVWLAIEPMAVVDRRTGARYAFPTGLMIAPKGTGVPRPITLRLPEAARGAMAAFEDARFEFHFRVAGMHDELAAPIEGREPTAEQNLLQREATDIATLGELEAIRVDDARRAITFLAGTWRVDRSFFLPAGYTVYAGPGVTIELRDGANLISHSPLRFEGTADDPIVIRSSGSVGGGVAVISAHAPSSFVHVRFENLSAPVEGHWTTTGAVTLCDSPARLIDCRFTGGMAEDQLNIIRSDFTIERCAFASSMADALDVDFGSGSIDNCQFTGIGNDAVDVSGSRVSVRHCRMSEIGDKALSAGENSTVTVEGLEGTDCRFGLVSKDLSTVTAEDVTLRRVEVALAAYQKKPEYGPASITIDKLLSEGRSELMLVEKGSWITLDGDETRGVKLGVARAIYGP